MEVMSNQIQSASIEATITRADGTVEHLGVISEYKRSMWRTLLSKFSRQRSFPQ